MPSEKIEIAPQHHSAGTFDAHHGSRLAETTAPEIYPASNRETGYLRSTRGAAHMTSLVLGSRFECTRAPADAAGT